MNHRPPPSALDAHMRRLRREEIQPLPQEEVSRLARLYRETGDPAARRRLVESNLALVVKIAREYGRDEEHRLELIQEGSLGLIDAIERYDPDRGIRLSAYASWWVRSHMLRFIVSNFRLVRIGKADAERRLFWSLLRQWQAAEALGIQEEEIVRRLAEEYAVSEGDVSTMRTRLGMSEVSLGTEMSASRKTGAGAEETLQDRIPDPAPLADEALGSKEECAVLHGALSLFRRTLTDAERTILRDRWLSEKPQSLRAIGEVYGMGRSWAQSIENDMMRRLRQQLGPVLGEMAPDVPEEEEEEAPVRRVRSVVRMRTERRQAA